MPDTREELIAEYVRASFEYEEAFREFSDIPINEYADSRRLAEASVHEENVRRELRHRYPDEDW